MQMFLGSSRVRGEERVTSLEKSAREASPEGKNEFYFLRISMKH